MSFEGGESLDFERTLQALLAFIGKRVEVGVFTSEPRGLVATFGGELQRGSDTRHPALEGRGELFVFMLAEGESALVLAEDRFGTARRLVEFPNSVRVELKGGLVVQVDLLPKDDPV